jgi:hypothetical protein
MPCSLLKSRKISNRIQAARRSSQENVNIRTHNAERVISRNYCKTEGNFCDMSQANVLALTWEGRRKFKEMSVHDCSTKPKFEFETY